jgi:hypothetical protein
MKSSSQYDVFLSHNSADKPAVELIADRLSNDGIRPFLDKWHLTPGALWQSELADALKQSACAAIFFGASGEGPWHNQEMQLALNNAARTTKSSKRSGANGLRILRPTCGTYSKPGSNGCG